MFEAIYVVFENYFPTGVDFVLIARQLIAVVLFLFVIYYQMSKVDDNQFYLDAVTEFEGKNRDKALWDKCVTLHEGDYEKMKNQYLKESAEKFKSKGLEDKRTEMDKRTEISTTLEGRFFITNLKEGNYGLFKTYWVYYVSGEIIFNLMMQVIKANGRQESDIFGDAWGAFSHIGGVYENIIIFIYLIVYKRFVWVGIWRAANHYKGNWVLAILAKVSVVLSVQLYIFFAVIGLYKYSQYINQWLFGILAIFLFFIVTKIYKTVRFLK